MVSRLNQLQKYLKQALVDPENNRLYIEDLKLSIVYEQQKTTNPNDFIIGAGFVDNERIKNV